MLQISKKNTVSFRDEVPEKWTYSLWTQSDSFSVSLHFKFLVIFLCHWAFIFLCGQMLLHILFIYYPIYFTVGTTVETKVEKKIFNALLKNCSQHQAFSVPTWYTFFFQCLLNCHQLIQAFFLIVHFILDFTTKLTYTQAFKQEM